MLKSIYFYLFHILGKMQEYTMPEYLCEVLIVEIFTRLPPKSLLRFSSLSKSLYSIICSPNFIRIHTFRSPQKILIRHTNREIFYTLHSEEHLASCTSGISATNFPYNSYYWIVGSCNGILCLYDNSDENHVILWNPSIRRKLNLPICPLRCFQIGFGFDPITDDYKIVSIPKYYGGGRGRGITQSSFVYTMKKGCWCEIGFPSSSSSSAYGVLSFTCFVNGALHWVVVKDYLTDSNDDVGRYILTFDLSTHVFGMISLPEPNWETRHVTTIQDSLAVISWKHDQSWIWIRREASWSVVYKFVEGVMGVLQLSNNYDLLVRTYGKTLQIYNSKTGARSELVGFNDVFYRDDIVLCVESLQLLDTGIPDLS
ncbi:hypothetical protein Lser_V15G23746 [Lactuca serriola]